jgi:hypothetical protein
MCVVSGVYDHFNKLIPLPWPQPIQPWVPVVPTTPPPIITIGSTTTEITPSLAEELRQLIREFREAVAAAKTVDRLTGQPDCADPDKAKLEERVAALEKELAKLKKGRK